MYGYVPKVQAEPLHRELVEYAEYIRSGEGKPTSREIHDDIRVILECHGVDLYDGEAMTRAKRHRA